MSRLQSFNYILNIDKNIVIELIILLFAVKVHILKVLYYLFTLHMPTKILLGVSI
jgi:hypothetical protein